MHFCAVSLHVTETPKAIIKDLEPPLPIIPFWYCRVRFCWTTFPETAVFT